MIRTEEQAREDIARGDACFNHQLSLEALDGRPESIAQVVSILRLPDKIRATDIKEKLDATHFGQDL